MYYGCINTFDWYGWKGNGTEGEHFHRIIFSVCLFLFCFVLRLFFFFLSCQFPFVTILDSTIDRQCGSHCCCVDFFFYILRFLSLFSVRLVLLPLPLFLLLLCSTVGRLVGGGRLKRWSFTNFCFIFFLFFFSFFALFEGNAIMRFIVCRTNGQSYNWNMASLFIELSTIYAVDTRDDVCV